MADLKNELQPLIKGEISIDPSLLEKYSRDASLFQVKPSLIAIPQDEDDIKSLVSYAGRNPSEKISLTVRSGATDMTGGPLNESVILDVSRLDKIIEVGESPRSSSGPLRHSSGEASEADGYAVTQPGVFYRDFEKATLAKNLLMPAFPASREICTVGGMVANNAGGEKTLTYGQTKEYVQELKVVLADGNSYEIKPLDAVELGAKMAQQDFEGDMYRQIHSLLQENYDLIQEHKPKVSKNSAGYYLWDVWDRRTFDLTKLFTGSQGTLGIITEIKFKLIRPKPYSKLLIIFLNDFKLLAKVAGAVMRFKPESFESFDDKTLKLALRFLPDFIKLLGKNIFALAWQFLPEFGLVLSGGVPKLILLAEFTGDSEKEVDDKLQQARQALAPFSVQSRITRSQDEAKKYWTIRRESFNLLRYHIKDKRTAPFIDDMVVKPEYLPEFLPRLEALLQPYNLVYSIAGHVGDGNFHIIPLMTMGDQKIRQIIPELSKKIYGLILEFHGSITGEHND
ncbi:MAG: FAD-binding oxidoreductase, partial [Candidatus Yanofskybacteria bacterium]|nr:FAD-binding oxidoreductase [Candidatus Yanofskybacteria bacterium]